MDGERHMIEKEVDVLVVGAGPAGSGAAMEAASAGATTLMIDRKREIGTPVQCGEVIGKSLLEMTGLKLPGKIICARQRGTRFIINRKITVTNSQPYWESITVERKLLDKYLATEAARKGACVQAETRLTDIEVESGIVSRVQLIHRGNKVNVSPGVVVAADGVHSTVCNLMGLSFHSEDEVARGIEFEMVSSRPLPPYMHIFLEPEVGLGYGWIIPKGRWRANVGIGRVGSLENRKATLERWICSHPFISRYFDMHRVLEVKSGDAPVPGFRGGPVKGNVIFTGDAAGQTLAFVGEGIIPSYASGRVAGRVAAMASFSRDLDQLKEYDRILKDGIGRELCEGASIKDHIMRIWMRPDLNAETRTIACGLMMSEVIGPEELLRMTGEKIMSLFDEMVLRELAGSAGKLRIAEMRG